jgi:hypothetical protein
MCAADWRRKGVIPPNSYSNEIVSSLDVFPTLANLTGAALPTDRPIDGKNMVGGGEWDTGTGASRECVGVWVCGCVGVGGGGEGCVCSK